MPDRSLVWDIDPDSLARFTAGLERPATSGAWLRLRRAAEELALLPAFDRLITLDMNRIEELPHQIRVAQQVLQPPMSGRAILADEVGLGKTIEAGIIMKELSVRGLARRVLVLTPASLVTQWVDELEDKFFEELTPIESPEEWETATRAIASYDRARQDAHAAALLRHRWDLVIVDEAHKCKNHRTARYQLIQQIRRNYLLLLTATPIQNDLRELYNLVTLLRPGHFGTWREFQRQYVMGGNTRQVRQPEALRDLAGRVMIRTRRASVAHIMSLPPRRPKHPSLELTPAEADLYVDTARLLRDLYKEGFRTPSEEEERSDRRRKRAATGRGIYFLECLRLAQRLCSSAPALATSLEHLAQGELVLPDFRRRARAIAERAAQITAHAKLAELSKLLVESPDRVVVFSEHLPTIDLVAKRAPELGRPAIAFTGSLGRLERHKALKRFKAEPRAVLVSTRAGAEGLNLQFCHQLVNYELPWNPMVVEQRIGRVHRFGQTREVELYNYAARGTVESHILRLLHTKIRLFELVVGELDLILERMDDDDGESFEGLLGELWLDADSDEAFERKMEDLGDRVAAERAAAVAEEEQASAVAAEDAAGRLEREFTSLTVPARLRLGYGTVQMSVAPGVESVRQQLGLHVNEIFDALGSGPAVEPAGMHPDYGPVYRVTGVTATGRAVTLTAQADRLPLTLVELSADPAAPLGA
ncbi:MAG TPA: DEAD/DEAH box helicase [Gemmatimonadales bacterium]|nr:DEAD/DEAH box helicase [Gemmatimonadales bacterium]